MNVLCVVFKFAWKLFALFFTLMIWHLDAEELINLEEMRQEFVLETRRIEIPDHPHAFNPSIVYWQGSILMSFRIIPDPKASFTSYLGFVWLDDDFNLISEPQILNLRQELPTVQSRAEDARLIVVGDRLYMVYDDNLEAKISKGGFRVFVAELTTEDGVVSLINNECLTEFEGASRDRREKAWVPFDYRGSLLLAYAIDPHVIFYPILGTGVCQTIARTQSQLAWPFGDLRGGTPGVCIDGHYLAFFHSSVFMRTEHSDGVNMTHYFMGAYLYDSEPPFALTAISPEPIIGPNFYSGIIYKYYWKPIRAVFPCGFVCQANTIWVAYGRDDHEMWVVKLDKKGLFDSLIPVEQGCSGDRS